MLDPRNPLARYEKAGVLAALGTQSGLEQALHELGNLSKLAPQEASVYFQVSAVQDACLLSLDARLLATLMWAQAILIGSFPTTSCLSEARIEALGRWSHLWCMLAAKSSSDDAARPLGNPPLVCLGIH